MCVLRAAEKVKLNTLNLESYPWVGNYYSSFTLNLIATPSNTNYVFDHWELEKTETALNSTVSSNFSVTIGGTDNFVAVFTDITNPVNASGEGANVPNAFTPNDDGLNDYFRPLGSGKYVNEYQMTIWNRWGQEVFRSTDPKATGWDGNFKGEKAPVGVYAYIITYRNVNGESKIAKGNVTLTR